MLAVGKGCLIGMPPMSYGWAYRSFLRNVVSYYAASPICIGTSINKNAESLFATISILPVSQTPIASRLFKVCPFTVREPSSTKSINSITGFVQRIGSFKIFGKISKRKPCILVNQHCFAIIRRNNCLYLVLPVFRPESLC